jgi:hypothetical protein
LLAAPVARRLVLVEAVAEPVLEPEPPLVGVALVEGVAEALPEAVPVGMTAVEVAVLVTVPVAVEVSVAVLVSVAEAEEEEAVPVELAASL